MFRHEEDQSTWGTLGEVQRVENILCTRAGRSINMKRGHGRVTYVE